MENYKADGYFVQIRNGAAPVLCDSQGIRKRNVLRRLSGKGGTPYCPGFPLHSPDRCARIQSANPQGRKASSHRSFTGGRGISAEEFPYGFLRDIRTNVTYRLDLK